MIFQEARKFTVATMQHVIFDEWLPVFLGDTLPAYSTLKTADDPQISDLFESIIPAYFYSLIGSFVFKVNSDCSSGHSLMRTCNSFDDPLRNLIDGESDKVLAGLLLQSAQQDDHFFVEDIQRFAKGSLDFTRQDLIAVTIQQTRDFSTLNYLDSLKKLSLDNSSYDSFDELAQLWPFAIQSDQV